MTVDSNQALEVQGRLRMGFGNPQHWHRMTGCNPVKTEEYLDFLGVSSMFPRLLSGLSGGICQMSIVFLLVRAFRMNILGLSLYNAHKAIQSCI